MSSIPRDRRVKTGGFPGAPWGSLGLLISMREAVSKNMVEKLFRKMHSVNIWPLYTHLHSHLRTHTHNCSWGVIDFVNTL